MTMSPLQQLQQGKMPDLVDKPILKYFKESEDKNSWICNVVIMDGPDQDNENICGIKISNSAKNKDKNTNLGNSY